MVPSSPILCSSGVNTGLVCPFTTPSLNAKISLEGHQAVDKNLAVGLRAPSKPLSAQVVSHPPAPPGHGYNLRAHAKQWRLWDKGQAGVLYGFGALQGKETLEEMPAGRGEAEEFHFPGHTAPLPKLSPFLPAVMGCDISLLWQLGRLASPPKKT